MVYEMRVYTLQPGKVPEFQALIEEGLPVISKYSKLVGWWSTEVGPLNEVVHIWAYEDMNHRAQARAAQAEDPQMQVFRPKAQGMIVSQYNKILTPGQLLAPAVALRATGALPWPPCMPRWRMYRRRSPVRTGGEKRSISQTRNKPECCLGALFRQSRRQMIGRTG